MEHWYVADIEWASVRPMSFEKFHFPPHDSILLPPPHQISILPLKKIFERVLQKKFKAKKKTKNIFQVF
jgi:hypothetical protein